MMRLIRTGCWRRLQWNRATTHVIAVTFPCTEYTCTENNTQFSIDSNSHSWASDLNQTCQTATYFRLNYDTCKIELGQFGLSNKLCGSLSYICSLLNFNKRISINQYQNCSQIICETRVTIHHDIRTSLILYDDWRFALADINTCIKAIFR